MIKRHNGPFTPCYLRDIDTGQYLANSAVSMRGPKWTPDMEQAYQFIALRQVHCATWAVKKMERRSPRFVRVPLDGRSRAAAVIHTLAPPQPPAAVSHIPNEMSEDALQKVIAALQEETTACEMYFQAMARRKSAEATYRFLSGSSA